MFSTSTSTSDAGEIIVSANKIDANAVFGSGGNIEITTELIFTDLTSDKLLYILIDGLNLVAQIRN